MWTLACGSGRVASGPAMCRTTKRDQALTDSDMSSQIRPSSGPRNAGPVPRNGRHSSVLGSSNSIALRLSCLSSLNMGQRSIDVSLLDQRVQERLFWLVGV